MASGDAEQYRAIGVPRFSALLRFTLSSRTSPARTVRRVGCKTILCLAEIAFYTCLIHLQRPYHIGARDVPRHLVTTSTATCGCNHRVFETHTPCWRFKRSARGFRERCAFSSFDRCTPQHRSNSHARMTLACGPSRRGTANQARYTNSSFDPAISITSPGERSTPAASAG